MSDDRVILITGATGQQGGAIARELLASGHKVRALTRNPESKNAQALAALGAEVVKGDLNDDVSVRSALEGVWGALGVQNTWEAGVEGEEVQGKRFAELAREVGVQHFVYQSVGSADQKTGIPHFDNKYRIEETVKSLGFPSWTIIRPVFFMDNLTSPWFKPYLDQGNLAIGVRDDTPIQMISVADIGKYGARAFQDAENLNGEEIDIAGDELTAPEAAQILSEVTGRPISFYSVPIEQVREASDDFATMLEWFDSTGYSADIEGNADDFEIEPTSFRAWATTVDWTPAADA